MATKDTEAKGKGISPRWASWEDASIYSGLSIGTLKNSVAAGQLITSNVVIKGNSRGRRLVDLRSLDALIEEGISRPPSEIAMNRKSVAEEVGA
jgi:hypothetical protein